MNRHHLYFVPGTVIGRRLFAWIAAALAALLFLLAAVPSAAAEGEGGVPAGAPVLDALSAILMDAETGQVLYQLNADEAKPPASMSKMMTEYLVFQAVKEGRLNWDQEIKVGKNAAAQIGSRIFLAQGDVHTVRELYIAMAVGSANDATVQLAESVAGSEEEFSSLMNETAAELGMTTAHFINSTGLDRADMPEEFQPSSIPGETVMSARDSAILAYHIIKEMPEALETSKITSYKFRPRDDAPIINWNWMLEGNKDVTNFKKFAYDGVDGLKTGHTEAAGNCFTGTALRDGTRLIAVVMGVPGTTNDGHRFLETAKLFDYGFGGFEKQTIIEAKAAVPEHEVMKVKKGKAKQVSVVTGTDVTILAPKGSTTTPAVQTVTQLQDPIVAPVEVGSRIGTATYTYTDPATLVSKTVDIDLIAAEEVEKASWWRLLLRAIGEFFSGLFKGIVGLF